MNVAEIETELGKFSAADLRQLALSSWSAFLTKEAQSVGAPSQVCEEDDPDLLNALDLAVVKADQTIGHGHSAADVRNQIRVWTTG